MRGEKLHSLPSAYTEADYEQSIMTQCELWTDNQDMTDTRYDYEMNLPVTYK